MVRRGRTLLSGIMKESSQADVAWESLGPEATIESLGFDSLTILDLIYDIQQTLNIEFEAEELVSIKTVGALAEFLKDKLPG